ncbi:putative retrotransposon hot spot (RHS) protein, partial [Trypanosoma cruzi]
MPPKRNRVQGGNARSRASAVPQGDVQRRTRPESEDETDQPAATHIRVEEARQPQWTMNSTVKDILMEGSTLRTDMKLNDFLRNYVGGTAAVGEDSNVTMEVFVQEPDDYVQDQRLLKRICNLTAYQALEERKILLEATYKLHHEGVVSLEQWRDYEGKDTVTLLVWEKLNGVLTQLLREERREAEERARREHRERFTLTTTIRIVLFKGRARVMNIKLNDFLTMELEGKGILRANRNLLLEDFLKDPTSHIRDAGVLNEIRATGVYARMEGTVREEMDLEEEVRKLHDKGVNNVLGWSRAAEGVKASVRDDIKNSLDAALEEARNSTTTIAPIYLEGYYESVYNARWHHVVEVPGGEGTGMEVKEGKPPQSWTYKKADNAIEKDDAVQQSGAAPPVLMVLTSDKKWPYTWAGSEHIRDCCVNSEVERVWQIVRNDLTEWFSSHGVTDFSPEKRVLIGTPGIGKSMNAGSYLLYQLLHYDAEKLPMVAYIIKNSVYLFDKTKQTVSDFRSEAAFVDLLKYLTRCEVKGYIIYDVSEQGKGPHVGLPFALWGMIVVTSPNVNNFKGWMSQNGAMGIVMDCPDESDVKAMCVWKKRNEQGEQNGYCKQVKERMDEVGPILRVIFNAKSFNSRKTVIDEVINVIDSSNAKHYVGVMSDKLWEAVNPSHKLVQIVRVRKDLPTEKYLNSPASRAIANKIYIHLSTKMHFMEIFKLLMHPDVILLSIVLEMSGTVTFMCRGAVNIIIGKLKELNPPEGRALQQATLQRNPAGHPTEAVGLPTKQGLPLEKNFARYGVMYKPAFPTFPLVDAFFFMESPRRTLVGLQM